MDRKKLIEYYNNKSNEINEYNATYGNKIYYKRFFYNKRHKDILKVLNPASGQLILDVGCGIGYYAKSISKKGSIVYATDISKGYIKQARKLNKGTNNIRYYVQDATELKFKNNYFDKVLITEVIEHIPEYKKAINEIHRVLKPGGVVILTTPNKYSYMNIAYKFKRFIKGYNFNEHVIEFNSKKIIELMDDQFDDHSINYTNYIYPFPIDEIVMKFNSQKIDKFSKKLETILENSLISRSFGWTMIYKGFKKV